MSVFVSRVWQDGRARWDRVKNKQNVCETLSGDRDINEQAHQGRAAGRTPGTSPAQAGVEPEASQSRFSYSLPYLYKMACVSLGALARVQRGTNVTITHSSCLISFQDLGAREKTHVWSAD